MRWFLLVALVACQSKPVAATFPNGTTDVDDDTDDTTDPDTTDTDTTDTEDTVDSADTGTTDAPWTDSGTTDTGPAPELVTVAHDREMRGVWIATVFNINWPKSQGQSAAAAQADLIELLDVAVDSGMNAVFLQIRPESDALYDSSIEPWSRYLSGSQGTDPGWDPLQFAIDEGHARGLEIHGWMNPYRAKGSSSYPASSDHISVTQSSYAYTYNGGVWMDPGVPAVQDQLEDVIVDVVSRYDIDGIHFDDYFYPYPDGTAFPDSSTYATYGGGMSLADWRRDNVNQMMERVSGAIAGIDPAVRFGIAPFGIYRPGQPSGITGLDQYAELYADPVLWKASGWVDYLAPQLYWPTTQTAQAYEPLLDWWAELPESGRYTFAGNALYQLDSSSAWTVQEFRDQVAISRGRTDAGSYGNIWYQIAALEENRSGIRDVFRDELYDVPALPPPVFDMAGVSVDPPTVISDANGVGVTHADARWWVIYADDGLGGWAIDRIVPSAQGYVTLGSGRWAVAAAGKHGVESLGVVAEIP